MASTTMTAATAAMAFGMGSLSAQEGGDIVLGGYGWQRFSVVGPERLFKVPADNSREVLLLQLIPDVELNRRVGELVLGPLQNSAQECEESQEFPFFNCWVSLVHGEDL